MRTRHSVLLVHYSYRTTHQVQSMVSKHDSPQRATRLLLEACGSDIDPYRTKMLNIFSAQPGYSEMGTTNMTYGMSFVSVNRLVMSESPGRSTFHLIGPGFRAGLGVESSVVHFGLPT